MKIENIPAEIKSKSLKEAKDEINEILCNLKVKIWIYLIVKINTKVNYLNKHVGIFLKINLKKLKSFNSKNK